MVDFTRITPNLWVGSHPTRADALAIARAGATHALDVRGEPSANGAPEVAEPELWAGTGVQYARVPMRDNGTPIPAAKYAEAVGLIEQAMGPAFARGTVFLYCAAGQSRSPSVAYAYLRHIGLSPAEARAAVFHRRVARDQYFSSAERYVTGAPIPGTSTGTTGTGKPSSDPSVPSPGKTDEGSSFFTWLAIGAALTGVYYLAKSGGPRANPLYVLPFGDKAVDRSGRLVDNLRTGGPIESFEVLAGTNETSSGQQTRLRVRYRTGRERIIVLPSLFSALHTIYEPAYRGLPITLITPNGFTARFHVGSRNHLGWMRDVDLEEVLG